MPYLGYIEIPFTSPKEFIGIEAILQMFALIVPNLCVDSQSLVLFGTNTLDVLYELNNKACPRLQLPNSNGFKALLKDLELRHKQAKDSTRGLVTMYNKGC